MHLPEAFINRMKEDLGEREFYEFISSYDEKPVRSLRLNTLKVSRTDRILKEYKERFPDKNLWAFTGFYYDTELLVDGSHPRCEVTDEILGLIDVLVDGRFILSKKDITLVYRGSSNQRIIDMQNTRAKGEVVLWDEHLATN